MMRVREVELNGVTTPLSEVLQKAAEQGAQFVHLGMRPEIGGDNRATIITDVDGLRADFNARRGRWHCSSVMDLRGEEPVERTANDIRYGVLEA